MKLLQIFLSLLLVITPIACASAPKTTPDAIRQYQIRYGV